MTRCHWLIVAGLLSASSSAWPAENTAIRGHLFIQGNPIQAPFVFSISNETAFVNGIRLFSPPAPHVAPDPHPERAEFYRKFGELKKEIHAAGLADRSRGLAPDSVLARMAQRFGELLGRLCRIGVLPGPSDGRSLPTSRAGQPAAHSCRTHVST
jgi:hypothetical protein